MQRRLSVVAVALGVGMLTAACGPPSHRPSFHKYEDDIPEFSAAQLGEPMDEGAIADMLGPNERAAVQRAGLPVHEASAQEEGDLEPPHESKWDQAGYASVAALGVGVTLFMMAAPYFLF